MAVGTSVQEDILAQQLEPPKELQLLDGRYLLALR